MKGERPLFPEAEMVSERTRAMWRERVDFLIENGQGSLSDWEDSFVQDIERRLDQGRDLTLSQSGKLGEIFHAVEGKVG